MGIPASVRVRRRVSGHEHERPHVTPGLPTSTCRLCTAPDLHHDRERRRSRRNRVGGGSRGRGTRARVVARGRLGGVRRAFGDLDLPRQPAVVRDRRDARPGGGRVDAARPRSREGHRAGDRKRESSPIADIQYSVEVFDHGLDLLVDVPSPGREAGGASGGLGSCCLLQSRERVAGPGPVPLQVTALICWSPRRLKETAYRLDEAQT